MRHLTVILLACLAGVAAAADMGPLDHWNQAVRLNLHELEREPVAEFDWGWPSVTFVILASVEMEESGGFAEAYAAEYPEASTEDMRWAAVALAVDFWRQGYSIASLTQALELTPPIVAYVRDGVRPTAGG